MTAPRFSRRSVLSIAGLSATMAGLAACSTSSSTNTSSGSDGGSGGQQLVLWTWPEGFAKPVLDSVPAAHPGVSIRQDVIGGEFKQKLSTALQASADLPAITGIKGEDIAFFASQPDYFVDLNTLGAADHKGDFLAWKWDQATTTDGRQLGIPIDIGPTALFYRFDVFEEMGLPSEPYELAAAITSWDEYFALGEEMLAKDSSTYLIRNAGSVFDVAVKQSGKNFVDESGTFIGDGDHVKSAWDLAVKAHKLGINAALQSSTPDSQAAVAAGKLPADFGASWHLSDLMVDAPETSGKWHVCAHPGPAINNGGSFLGIPAKTEIAETAFEVILTILNAENQIAEYLDKGNFPANRGAFESEELHQEIEFLGGQRGAEVFAKAAETVRPLYENPFNNTVAGPFSAELELVEASGKDSEQAFADAVDQAKRLATQNGLTVK